MNLTPDQRKANRKTGLFLAAVVLVVFFGFIAKMFLESR